MDISPLQSSSPITRLQGSKAVNSPSPLPNSTDVSSYATNDTVEISDSARYLAEVKKLPDVRQSKVDAARAAIANGTFETPERLNGTVNRLFAELGG